MSSIPTDHSADPLDVASDLEERERTTAIARMRGKPGWVLPYCKWCHELPRMCGSNYCSPECCEDAGRAERRAGA